MPETMTDKRNSNRIAFVASAEVTEVATGTRLSARSSDLSRSGCYIDTLNPTLSNIAVRVRLTHHGEELELPGRVVYVSPRLGMGIRFDENLSPAQITILERWIATLR